MTRKRNVQVAALVLLLALAIVPLVGCSAAGGSAQGSASGSNVSEQELPAKYDMREKGLVTPVKKQSPFSSCWAFGGIAAAESSIISASGGKVTADDIDLSEKHLTWYAEQAIVKEDDPTQVGEGMYLMDASNPNAVYDTGGIRLMTGNLFASAVGPLAEADCPYRGKNAITASAYYREHPEVAREDAIKAFNEEYKGASMAEVAKNNGMSEEQYANELVKQLVDGANELDEYSKYDDWSLPAVTEGGQSARSENGGYVLTDTNTLPRPTKRDEENNYLETNMDAIRSIKEEILAGRAVSIMLLGDDGGQGHINKDTWAQYVGDGSKLDHVVCIVGWDDNYPVDNFLAESRPPAAGAWLIKNSWGSESDAGPDDKGNVVNKMDWGIVNEDGKYTGYFWCSYYDQSLDEAETMAFDTDLDKDEYIIANQYDYMPAIEDPIYNLSEDRLATANTFEQDSDFDLASVSTQTSEPNTKVVFKVYLNDKGAKSPEDGKEVASVEQTFKYGGYHRVKLPQSVRINKGQTFSVVCEATHQSDGKTLYEVCANRQVDKNDAVEAELPYYTKAVVNKNESFVFLDNRWVDLVEQPLVYEAKGEERPAVVDNFKIKAFGLPVKS